MKMASPTLSLDNPVMSHFAFYTCVCILKMFAVTFFTVFRRFQNNIFANPEDYPNTKNPDKNKPVYNNEYVERARRNHLNDLENIPVFVLVGFLYVLTGPSLSSALLHFRLFTGARIVHTIAYQQPLPQPSRALSFFVGFGVTVSMAYSVMMATQA